MNHFGKKLLFLLLTLGSYILLWRRGTSVLTAATLMITRDPRLKLVDGYNLQISDVKIQDAGDYVCQIGDQESKDQVHTLEILGMIKKISFFLFIYLKINPFITLVPPTLRAVPETGQVTARKGSTVTLECKASGT